MTRRPLLALVVLLAASSAYAQPTPPGPGLSKVTHGQTLTGNGTTSVPLDVNPATGGGLQGGRTVPLGLLTTCSATQVLAWNGAAWACSASGGAGTITAIVTGPNSGLTGGCSLGSCSLSMLTSCASGQVLSWSGSAWACSTPGTGTHTGSLTSGKVPRATGTTTLTDGSWSDTGSVVGTTSTLDVLGGIREGVSYATLPSGVTTDWDPFGGGAATPIVVVTVNNADSIVDSIDASKFSPVCLSNKAPRLRLMHDATNHGTLFLVNREGSASTNINNKIDLPSNMPVTVAMPHRGVIDLEYQCPLNVWKVVGNHEAQMGGSFGFVSSITDAALGSTVTDYNPTGFDTASELRLGPSGASSTIASMVARSDTGGRIQFVKCITALGTLIIQDTTHSSGTAQYRFLLPGNQDLTLPAYTSACFRYDAAQTYWMLAFGGPGLLSSGGTISGLTTNTIPIATSATTLGNSALTVSGGLLRVNSSALTIDTTSGAMIVNNTLAVNGPTNVDTLNLTNAAAGQTATNSLLNAVKLGSMNTTAGSLFSFGVRSMAQTSKSAGANTLFNVGGWFDARNGDANYAIYADAGSVLLNGSSGTTTIGGAATMSSTLGVTGATTLSSTLAVTGAATMSSTLAVTGSISSNSTKWTSGTGVPAISCAIGDLFTRTNGSSGTTLYSCTATNTWTAVGGGGGSGTVTSIVAGTGLSGGTITTTGTIAVNLNSGSAQTCSAGQHVSALSAAGLTTCSTDSGGAPSVISPAQLTTNTNDWAPTGIGTATTVNVDTSNTWQLTGISAGTDGQKLTLHNIGANSFYLITASGSSSAANRFAGGSGAYLIQSGADAMLEYRGGSTNRWIVEFVGGQFVYDLYVLNAATFANASVTIGSAATVGTTLGVTGAVTTGNNIIDNGTKPTLSSCATSSVTSNAGAYSFDIAVTAGTTSSCTATFATACPHTPTCFVESYDETKNNMYVSAHSTTAVTVTATSSPGSNLNGNSFGVFCVCH